MAERPKRRKSNDNPYTLNYCEETNIYTISFKDGNGVLQKIEVSESIFKTFDRFELDDLSQMNEYDNHIEHSEVFENTLNKRILHKPVDVEEIVETNTTNKQLKKAINCLTEVQKRRIKLYYFEDKTVEEIAKLEKTSHQAVSETIRKGIVNIRKFLKN